LTLEKLVFGPQSLLMLFSTINGLAFYAFYRCLFIEQIGVKSGL
jgi:hypothetical protein